MKHQEMREATSRAIMDAFWSLYRDLPVEKITVKAICEKAGCNRSTFYEYYTDSYSVLEAIEEELMDYVRRKLTEELPASLARSFPEIRLDAETLAPLSDMYSKRGEYFSILTGVKGDPYFQYKYKQTVQVQADGQGAAYGDAGRSGQKVRPFGEHRGGVYGLGPDRGLQLLVSPPGRVSGGEVLDAAGEPADKRGFARTTQAVSKVRRLHASEQPP